MRIFQDSVPLLSTNLYRLPFSPMNLFGFQGSSNYSFPDSSNSKSTVETPNSSTETNGITEVQGAPQYGNYLNIGNLSAKDRKFIRLSGGYLFVDSDGKVYNIAPGTSRKDMRKWYKQEKRAQEIARRRALFGGTTLFENSDLQRIYDAGVQNPNAQFISYSQKETPKQPINTPKYTYKFTGTKDSNNLYIALMNRLRSNDSEWTGKYAIDNVITNESVNNYLKETLGNNWGGELNNNIYQKLLDQKIIDQDYLDQNKITLDQEVPAQNNATSTKTTPAQNNATSTKTTPAQNNATSTKNTDRNTSNSWYIWNYPTSTENTDVNQKTNYLAEAPTKIVNLNTIMSWNTGDSPAREAYNILILRDDKPKFGHIVGYTVNGRPVAYDNDTKTYYVYRNVNNKAEYVKSPHLAWDSNKKYFTWHK